MEKTVNECFGVLSKCALFSGMTKENMLSFVGIMNGCVRSYRKGEFIHKPCEAFTRFGLVLSGCVEVCSDDALGNKMIMANVLPGVTFGEALCLLKTEDNGIYAYAKCTSRVLWLSPEGIFKNGTGDMQKRFSVLLAERTLSQNERIQVLSKSTVREKLITYFSLSASEKGGKTFTVPFGREDMAVYMGVNRSALSRELSKMKKEGIIDYRKNVFKIKQ